MLNRIVPLRGHLTVTAQGARNAPRGADWSILRELELPDVDRLGHKRRPEAGKSVHTVPNPPDLPIERVSKVTDRQRLARPYWVEDVPKRAIRSLKSLIRSCFPMFVGSL